MLDIAHGLARPSFWKPVWRSAGFIFGLPDKKGNTESLLIIEVEIKSVSLKILSSEMDPVEIRLIR